MDKLLKKFKSDDFKEVVDFYSNFDTSNDIIKWLKMLPSAPVKFFERGKDSDIVIVVTTPDHNSINAYKTELLFKEFKIIFVESSGPYFHLSKAVNLGIHEASKHNPKWIIYSNDDLYKIENTSLLKEQLLSLNHKNIDVVFRRNHKNMQRNSNVSYLQHIGLRNIFLSQLISNMVQKTTKEYLNLLEKFNMPFIMYDSTAKPFRRFYTRMLMKSKPLEFPGFSRLFIFNKKYASKHDQIFDEIYRNGSDDLDLDLSLYLDKVKYDFVNFNIGEYGGITLGRGLSRVFRDIANAAYFSDKFKNKGLIKILQNVKS